MWPFNKKEKKRIAELEQTLESYRQDNQYLRDENKRLEQFELKVKIMEMYVNDDEAILELLDIETKKKKEQDNYRNFLARQQEAMGNISQLQAAAAQRGPLSYTLYGGGLLGGIL